jgi:hypothetical protein
VVVFTDQNVANNFILSTILIAFFSSIDSLRNFVPAFLKQI